MLELIGPDGTVHYRRPWGHPDVQEWREMIADGRAEGYSIRGKEPFPPTPTTSRDESGED